MRTPTACHTTSSLFVVPLLATLLTGTAACSDGEGSGGTGAVPNGGHTATAGSSASGGGGGGAVGGAGGSGAIGGAPTGGAGGAGGSTDGGGGQAAEWGQIAGTCGQIDEVEIVSTSPFVFENAIDFGSQAWDYELLSTGGKKIWDDDNAGGSSLHSEVLAFEVLHRCELAALLKTETEIEYIPQPPAMTDILVSIDGYKVGVSVVRAFHYPPSEPYTLDEALAKMAEKLTDIQDSSASVLPADEWTKQILHVIAWDPAAAATVVTAIGQLDASVKADTIVVVTATNGTDEYLYFD